jgi:hypothetical protein
MHQQWPSSYWNRVCLHTITTLSPVPASSPSRLGNPLALAYGRAAVHTRGEVFSALLR